VAVPLWERVQAGDQSIIEDSDRLSDIRARWARVLGGDAALQNRLRSCGIDAANSVLCRTHEFSESQQSWSNTLGAVLTRYREKEFDGDFHWTNDSSYDSEVPLPFQELLIDFVQHGREQLLIESAAKHEVLAPSAKHDLERALLNHLTFVSNLVLGKAFYEYRFDKDPSSIFEFVRRERSSERSIYLDFIRDMRRTFEAFLQTYPVLARLLSQAVDQWVASCSLLARSIYDDFSCLQNEFQWQITQRVGAVTRVKSNLSDRHNRGQSVCQIELRSGEKLIYKPRSVGPEVAFYSFLRELNDLGLPLDLRVPRTIDFGDHGWVEFMESRSCRSEDEVIRFYRRSGMLLGVIHALAVSDVHYENLISCGEHPVIVDLETLLDESALNSSEKRNKRNKRNDNVRNFSIDRSGFIPHFQKDPDGHRFDLSALGADETQTSGVRPRIWKHINTDQMELVQDVSPEVSNLNRPRLLGKTVSASDYRSSIESGFDETYKLILRCNEELAANRSLMRRFDGLDLRVLVRGTQTYSRLLLHLLNPEFLTNGLKRSVELEWLARPLTGSRTSAKDRQVVYLLEIAALEKQDIPIFSASQWTREDFVGDDSDICRLWRKRDAQCLRRRLRSLNLCDMQRQLRLLRTAMTSRFGAQVENAD